MKLVIVESPAKAKTINKYLGKEYQVLASFGHVRDLPAQNDSVKPEKGFEMTWAVDAKGEKHLKEIVSALAKADELYLASDPDREGEAIAWHIVEELKRRKKLKVPYKRVVFNEITKSAVAYGIEHPREIDMNLVNAYLARRALDYLVGFTLSPVLWRKLPGSKSAGRVQSVALRLICEREKEIEAFKKEEYWTIGTDLETAKKEPFKATLSEVDFKKLSKFDIPTEEKAKRLKERIEVSSFQVASVEKKQVKRAPAPAFTTSTLQQEASRKLGYSAKKTMQIAQKLYEGGHITYMRTDGVALAQEAVSSMRGYIAQTFGKEYLPEKPRYYKNKVKNAQEAHEAIRPTHISDTPEKMASVLDKDALRLYELIFKRALACQMESAVLNKVAADLTNPAKDLVLHATGQTIAFPGFIKLYKEDTDDEKEEENTLLPLLKEGEAVSLKGVTPVQHFTEPPPRYSEAGLVKKMEELGIGRPSTYASILSVLQERAYAVLDKKRFIPEDRGQVVTAFLENFFSRYVQYDFTAKLEEELDDVSAGEMEWTTLLKKFWTDFDKTVQEVSPCRTAEVLDKVGTSLEGHLFPTPESRICPKCKKGKLGLKNSRYGAFIGCSAYPDCDYTRPFGGLAEEATEKQERTNEERLLGQDAGKREIWLKKGPYGWYVQQGMGKEAKRTSVPKTKNPEELTLEEALALLTLPRILGKDSLSDEIIEAGIGRFGPYVKRGKTFQSLEKTDDVLTITLERALALLTQKKKQESVCIGTYENEPILWQVGRFGPYLKWKKTNVALPKSFKSEEKKPTQEEAVVFLKEKLAK